MNKSWTHFGHKRPSRFQDVSGDVQSLRDKEQVSVSSQTDRWIQTHLGTHSQQELSLDVLIHIMEPGNCGNRTGNNSWQMPKNIKREMGETQEQVKTDRKWASHRLELRHTPPGRPADPQSDGLSPELSTPERKKTTQVMHWDRRLTSGFPNFCDPKILLLLFPLCFTKRDKVSRKTWSWYCYWCCFRFILAVEPLHVCCSLLRCRIVIL